MAPDALIISDPGVFAIARRVLPDMEIHISTQANNQLQVPICSGMDWGQGGWCLQRELSLAEDQGNPGPSLRICR